MAKYSVDSTMSEPAKRSYADALKKGLMLDAQENTWAKLQLAIKEIFLMKPITLDLEGLSKAVDNLCIHNLEENLYQKIEKECEEHISYALQSLVGQNTDLSVFLSLVDKCWQDFGRQMKMIGSIILPLDRKYVRSLWETGLQLFRKHLSLAPEVHQRTVTGLLSLIEKERLGEAVNRTILNHLLKMFTTLAIYTGSFEKCFLECTSEFYAEEGMKHMQQSDILEDMNHAEGRLHEENERCMSHSDRGTREPLMATTENELFEYHISLILDKGFSKSMDGRRTEDLQRMYTLLSRVNALEFLRQALSSYITKTGLRIVMDDNEDRDSVQALLNFRTSLDLIWEESFFKDELFGYIIEDSFQHLTSLQQGKLHEANEKYLDARTRKPLVETTEEHLTDKQLPRSRSRKRPKRPRTLNNKETRRRRKWMAGFFQEHQISISVRHKIQSSKPCGEIVYVEAGEEPCMLWDVAEVKPEDEEKLTGMDWTALSGPVRNQRSHDICWSYAGTDLFSATRLINKEDDTFRTFSTRYLAFYASKEMREEAAKVGRRKDTHHCHGYRISSTLKFIRDNGVPQEDPIEAKGKFSCVEDPPKRDPSILYKFDKKVKVRITNRLEEVYKMLLHQPVGANLHSFEPEFSAIGSKIYSGPESDATFYEGLHAVILIKIIRIGGKLVGVVKSSHGTGKGVEGYMMVSLTRMLIGIRENSCIRRPSRLLRDFTIPELLRVQDQEVR